MSKGYFVRPTVFGGVSNDMVIAREEIFGPVLVVIPFEDEADAIRIANDTPYGLAAYIAGDPAKAKTIAPLLRAGGIYINVAGLTVDFDAPFGGYKQSGNGRECGRFGIVDFLESKSVVGELV
jgi:aldehyde dehydrogenase (NAD+)